MAKFSFGKLISATAKAADKAIKAAATEREKKAKALESARIKAEKERLRKVKADESARLKVEKNKISDGVNRKHRVSDHSRSQNFDFVVGVEIKRSNNPDHLCEICRVGAGKYPKDFKWTGWHDGCKCITTFILKTPDEFALETQQILYGISTNSKSANSVNTIPVSLISYVASNVEFCSKQNWYKQNKKYFSTNSNFTYYF